MTASPAHPSLLLLADSHVVDGTPRAQEFRDFLAWVSTTEHDIAFLGDVLELWIGLKRYEGEPRQNPQRLIGEFLQWCAQETARRRVFFVEGNHEYFVVRHHRQCFTAAEPDELACQGLVLAHGDTAQGLCGHRRFRWWSKSRLAHFLLRFLPFAPSIVQRLKRNFERQSAMRVHRYPQEAVELWAQGCLRRHPAARRIILGHFHCRQESCLSENRLLTVLPAWKEGYQVGLMDFSNYQLLIQNWRSLAQQQP